MDGRAHEAELNPLPSHFAEIDGTPAHYLRPPPRRAHGPRRHLPRRLHGGCRHEQSTRPLTPSPALADSPAGLLARIVEKYRARTRLSDDDVLTQASLYWFTDTNSTSFLPYWEYDRGLTRRVTRVPAAVAVSPADLTVRRAAGRTAPSTSRATRRGPFAAWEEPGFIATDLRELFGRLGAAS
ncbi:hypothetical protein [Streptomyces sp. NPDC088674]|uniref:hypothetical protein n=1 Tax=Streptomyces sp. NPDC088674 TaxID=3365869 RepID=UPI0038141D06